MPGGARRLADDRELRRSAAEVISDRFSRSFSSPIFAHIIDRRGRPQYRASDNFICAAERLNVDQGVERGAIERQSLPLSFNLRNTQHPAQPRARLDEVTQGIALEDFNESIAGFFQCPPQNATLADCAGSLDRLEA